MKELKEAVRVSEEKYRALVETTGTGYLILDSQGRVVDANPEYVRLTGRRKLRDILGKPVTEWTADHEKEKNAQAVARCARDGSIRNFTVDYTDGLGRITPVEINATVVGKGPSLRIISLCRDITERRLAEATLKESEAQSRIINASALDAVVLMDDAGKVVYWNPAAESMFGFSAAEVVGKDVHSLIMPARYGKQFSEGFRRFTKSGTGTAIGKVLELSARCKDGKEIPIEIAVAPIPRGGRYWASAVIRDIGKRKQTEEALLESEARYRAVFDNARDSILVLESPPEGAPIIQDANFAALKMRGYSLSELVGKPISMLDAEEDPAAVIAERRRQLSASAGAVFEVHHKRKDGSILIAEASVKEISVGGKILIIDISRDITERKHIEATLATVQKLESLGTLAGGIAHDFNNILTAILGNLSLLQLRIDGKGEALELIQEAQEACDMAKSLSHQLLTFSKGGNPVVKVMDLRPLLTRVAGFATRGANSRCIFELGESPLTASIDKEQIAQVVQNLVINAAQAMPSGGEITVRAAALTLGKNEIPLLPAGRYVRVRIEDTGTGIQAEHLSKIFDPYFSTKAQGRGLGLAVCFSIMAKHGGNISVESKLGAGSVFTLHFPAANAADEAPECENPALTTGSGRVLIMDDEVPVVRALKRILECLGYQAESAKDGQAALQAYKKALSAGKPYAAVIMDLTIPGGMGGKEAMTKLAALDPKAKAIVSSGYANDPILSEYAAHGFRGMLAKPYRIEEVSEVLLRVIGAA